MWLLTTSETVDVVATADPAVELAESERYPVRLVAAGSVPCGPGVTRLTLRALSQSEWGKAVAIEGADASNRAVVEAGLVRVDGGASKDELLADPRAGVCSVIAAAIMDLTLRPSLYSPSPR